MKIQKFIEATFELLLVFGIFLSLFYIIILIIVILTDLLFTGFNFNVICTRLFLCFISSIAILKLIDKLKK
jgi:hypothetical protein